MSIFFLSDIKSSAHLHNKHVNTFVYELGCIADDESLDKQEKTDALKLSATEWARVKTFLSLLKVFVFLPPILS